MMKNILNLCRICSGVGEYDIFSPIPIYLHGNCNEYASWSKQISNLISEITGLMVVPSDGLPQKICALCISYLKHAITFRNQAINNSLSLMTALKLSNTNQCGKEKIESTELIDIVGPIGTYANHLNLKPNDINEESKRTFNDDTLYRNNINNNKNNVSKLSIKEELSQLKLDEDSEVSSSDENSETETIVNISKTNKSTVSVLRNYFDYAEVSFIEDDITELDIFSNENILVTIPEHFKERKCHFCRRRFMFEESFDEHIKECIHKKLVEFIREANHLLQLKEIKAISPHEFIRRMIFALKKNNAILSRCCGQNVSPEVLLPGSNSYDSTDRTDSALESGNSVNEIKKMNYFETAPNVEKLQSHLEESRENLDMSRGYSSPILIPLNQENETENKTVKSSYFYHTPQCCECSLSFDSIAELERHKFQTHIGSQIAKRTPKDKYVTVSDKDDDDLDGIIDVMYDFNFKRNNSNSEVKAEAVENNKKPNSVPLPDHTQSAIPLINNLKAFDINATLENLSFPNSLSSNNGIALTKNNLSNKMRRTKCSKCGKTFLTISHLDAHKMRGHKTEL